jgi:pilin/secretion family protein with methylation motif
MRDERGTTLIETMIAVSMLLVVMAGLMSLVATATNLTENQGHLGARATEYAVDKMEQLLDLTYGDAQSDTTVFPSANVGGTGLAVGGSVNTAAPVVGYVDYLKADGTMLCPCGAAAPAGWYYVRVWQVSQPSANLKQISVAAAVRVSFGNAVKATATVSAFKTNCPAGC